MTQAVSAEFSQRTASSSSNGVVARKVRSSEDSLLHARTPILLRSLTRYETTPTQNRAAIIVLAYSLSKVLPFTLICHTNELATNYDNSMSMISQSSGQLTSIISRND